MNPPSTLSYEVSDFCSDVSFQQKPFYVSVEPKPYCKMDCCFENVGRVVKECGGEIVYGWQIWLWEGVLIEAEFHAVWRTEGGEYVDITPKDLDYANILFLPDARMLYDGSRVDNIRKNLSNLKLVDMYIEIAKSIFLVKNKNSRPYDYEISLRGQDAEIYEVLSVWGYYIQQMLKNKQGRKSLCPCGSKKQFKICCEKKLKKVVEFAQKKYSI